MTMLTLVLAYIGGVLTILSPCILPVVPFIFARSDRPFWKSTFPVLVGMSLSFVVLAALSVAGGQWVVQASQIGRGIALVVFALLGVSLLSTRFAELTSGSLVSLGGQLQARAGRGTGALASLGIGASMGLVWAPCAGPILGLVLAGASVSSSTAETVGLLLAFALGAATALGAAAFAGGKLLSALKRYLGVDQWLRRGLGVAVLGAVLAIAFHLDTKLLTALPHVDTTRLEEHLVETVPDTNPGMASDAALVAVDDVALQDEGMAPSLDGAAAWLNSAPLGIEDLRGKVVLVDFWTYSCVNCLRTLPYLKAWDERYRSAGLVIIGVHTPEFAFERDVANVRDAAEELGIRYPIAIDNRWAIWSAYRNRYWPAHYFIDGRGHIRHRHFGEGEYEESERVIRRLLKELQRDEPSHAWDAIHEVTVPVVAIGTEAPPSSDIRSPETYLGYARQDGFVSTPEMVRDMVARYRTPDSLAINQWGVSGDWDFSAERAALSASGGALTFRFFARDVNLVLGAPEGATVRYRVRIDGRAPGSDHGEDVDAEGNGTVRGHRLYQLIRQKRAVRDRVITIDFFDKGVQAFAFTFG